MIKLTCKIEDIPIDFIKENLSPYQKEIIEIKYHIFSQYKKLTNEGKSKIDTYLLISEDVALEWETVQRILLKMLKKLV